MKIMTHRQWKTTQGRWLEKTLFWDFRHEIKSYGYTPNYVYTLEAEDLDTPDGLFPSLRRLYLESSDPSEYSFANAHLGGWDHWMCLTNSSWFRPYITEWRKELSIKLKSEAIAKMRAIASDPLNKNFYAANKYLAEEGWDTETKRMRQGRKSKSTVEAEARKLTKIDTDLKEDISQDFKRLFS